MKAMLSMNPVAAPLVFGEAERARLGELLDVDLDRIVTAWNDVDDDELAGVELLITGWGVPRLGPDVLDRMPSLRAIVHWGGGVGFVDRAAVARGIAIASARAANAVPVAEFTIAMIILASKDAFWVSRQYAQQQRFIDRESELADTGLYDRTVGIVGASSIGTLVMEMLQAYDVEVLLHHPRATPERASALGAQLVDDLAELASRSRILSVHAPERPETFQMISREVLAALPDGATVINTSRGSLIDQDALVDELRSGRIRAILDVTEPDVLPAGHPLYTLPNVFLTPHLAGSMGSELQRLGATTVAEVERIVAGLPVAHPIEP